VKQSAVTETGARDARTAFADASPRPFAVMQATMTVINNRPVISG
jgi:hypothetical protein